MTRVWTLEGPWPRPPLHENQRLSWQAKARLTSDNRLWAAWAAKREGIPALQHCWVDMVWIVPDRRRRDAENPVPTLKVFSDGLVDAKIVPDDTPEWMSKAMPVIEYRRGEARVLFHIAGDPL